MMHQRPESKEIMTQCCSCHKILQETGLWQPLAEVPLKRKNVLFSHGICPHCLVHLYPELAALLESKGVMG